MKTIARLWAPGGNVTKLFFRFHWHEARRFSRTNARSAPWASEEEYELQHGYSCFDDPISLAEYFEDRNQVTSKSAQLVIFEGTDVGVGDDGENLALPTRATEGFRAFLAPEDLPTIVRLWDEAETRKDAEDTIVEWINFGTRRT
jgi:hypothetical protein